MSIFIRIFTVLCISSLIPATSALAADNQTDLQNVNQISSQSQNKNNLERAKRALLTGDISGDTQVKIEKDPGTKENQAAKKRGLDRARKALLTGDLSE